MRFMVSPPANPGSQLRSGMKEARFGIQEMIGQTSFRYVALVRKHRSVLRTRSSCKKKRAASKWLKPTGIFGRSVTFEKNVPPQSQRFRVSATAEIAHCLWKSSDLSTAYWSATGKFTPSLSGFEVLSIFAGQSSTMSDVGFACMVLKAC